MIQRTTQALAGYTGDVHEPHLHTVLLLFSSGSPHVIHHDIGSWRTLCRRHPSSKALCFTFCGVGLSYVTHCLQVFVVYVWWYSLQSAEARDGWRNQPDKQESAQDSDEGEGKY